MSDKDPSKEQIAVVRDKRKAPLFISDSSDEYDNKFSQLSYDTVPGSSIQVEVNESEEVEMLKSITDQSPSATTVNGMDEDHTYGEGGEHLKNNQNLVNSSNTREQLCNNATSQAPTDFTAPFVVFLILFIISLFVIAYLVYQLRKYKKLYQDASKLPYARTGSRPMESKRDDFSNVASTFREDALSFTSSFKSHREESSPVHNFLDVPHITPIGALTVKRKPAASEEDLQAATSYKAASQPQEWQVVEDIASLNLKQIRVENWLKETEAKKCGVGEVNLDAPTPCFVKILKGEFGDKISAADDVASMSHVLHHESCDHSNLVKFYGSCVSKDSLFIVSEFVSSRTLLSVLQNSRTLDHSAVISTMSGSQLMNFVIGICEALYYLHGNDVVHGALCADHVLLNDLFVPKLYDCCGENSKRLKLKSHRWAAPEYLSSRLYTEKADIWSFGILIWEILSLGGKPFHECAEEMVPVFIRKQLQNGSSVLPITRNTTKRLWLLLQSCWAQEPSARPEILEVLTKLKRMKDASNAITVARTPGYTFFPSE